MESPFLNLQKSIKTTKNGGYLQFIRDNPCFMNKKNKLSTKRGKIKENAC
jgi:hypothetical protein